MVAGLHGGRIAWWPDRMVAGLHGGQIAANSREASATCRSRRSRTRPVGHHCIGHYYIGRNCAGHNYIGHKYTGHNCVGHTCVGRNYTGNTCVGQNYVGHNSASRPRCPYTAPSRIGHNLRGITIYSLTTKVRLEPHRGNNYTGHDYMGYAYIGHNYISRPRSPYTAPSPGMPPCTPL